MITEWREEIFLWPRAKNGRGFSWKYNFVEVVSEYYYVAKLLLIKDLIDNDAGVTRIDKYAMVFFGKKVKVVKKGKE